MTDRELPARKSGRPLYTLLLASTLSLTLAACGKGETEKPTGQVVARINGEDITQREVSVELEGAALPPNMTRREAEKVALNNIVTRRALAAAAVERELTKTPQFMMQERRTAEQLKVQALARDIAEKVSRPSRDETIAFMDSQPEMFAQRKIYLVDQIQFPRPENIDELPFDTANSMAEVEKILNDHKIAFRRQPATLDAAAANQNFMVEIRKMLERNPQELFMFNNARPGAAPIILMNQVRETRVTPFVGDKAIEFGTRYLHNQRIQEALAAEVEKQRTSANERVVYQEGWEPAEPAEGAAEAIPGQQAAEAAGALPLPDEHALPEDGVAPAAAPAD